MITIDNMNELITGIEKNVYDIVNAKEKIYNSDILNKIWIELNCIVPDDLNIPIKDNLFPIKKNNYLISGWNNLLKKVYSVNKLKRNQLNLLLGDMMNYDSKTSIVQWLSMCEMIMRHAVERSLVVNINNELHASLFITMKQYQTHITDTRFSSIVLPYHDNNNVLLSQIIYNYRKNGSLVLDIHKYITETQSIMNSHIIEGNVTMAYNTVMWWSYPLYLMYVSGCIRHISSDIKLNKNESKQYSNLYKTIDNFTINRIIATVKSDN